MLLNLYELKITLRKTLPMARYEWGALASFIFRANCFGRWVVTHSLAVYDFHGHCPAVLSNQHLSWDLMSAHHWLRTAMHHHPSIRLTRSKWFVASHLKRPHPSLTNIHSSKNFIYTINLLSLWQLYFSSSTLEATTIFILSHPFTLHACIHFHIW